MRAGDMNRDGADGIICGERTVERIVGMGGEERVGAGNEDDRGMVEADAVMKEYDVTGEE